MKIETILCAAFPGTGKSVTYNTFKNSEKIILDSDSSNFDKSQFPQNYIQHIKDNIGKADIIFISSHKEVRDALVENNLPFILVYPEKDLKIEYLSRYENRGNNSKFIKLLEENWDLWLDDCAQQDNCTHIVLSSRAFINDVLWSFK